MSTSPFGYPRTRTALLTVALTAPLLAAGCSNGSYQAAGKSLLAAPPPEIAAAPETGATATSGARALEVTAVSATKQLHFAAGRGQAQLATPQVGKEVKREIRLAAARQPAEVADPPMPSPPLGKATATQPVRKDKPAELATAPAAPPAVTSDTAQKLQPEGMAPARLSTLQAAATLVAVAPLAAAPSPAASKAAAPATAAASKAAPAASPLPTKRAMTPEEKEALRARAAELFLDPEPAPAASLAPEPTAKSAAKAVAAEAPEPAQPAKRRAAELFLDPEPAPAASLAPEPTAKAAAKAVAAAPEPAQPAKRRATVHAGRPLPAGQASAAASPTPNARSKPTAPAPKVAERTTASSNLGELPEVSVREAPLKLPPRSTGNPDQQVDEELKAAARVAPAAGSPTSLPPDVEVADPSGSTRILFDEASAVLSKDAQAELAKLASQIMDATQVRITILGYGDGGGSQPVEAGRARVLALSRVMAVRQFLMVRGLPAERLVARAMGNRMASGPASRVDVMVSQL